MTEPTVMYGTRRPFDSRTSIFLFDDLLNDYVDQHEHRKILQPWVLEKARAVYEWLHQNGISEEECMLCYYSYKRVETFCTSVRYHLHLDKPEHRTLFLLCKDSILETD